MSSISLKLRGGVGGAQREMGGRWEGNEGKGGWDGGLAGWGRVAGNNKLMLRQPWVREEGTMELFGLCDGTGVESVDLKRHNIIPVI